MADFPARIALGVSLPLTMIRIPIDILLSQNQEGLSLQNQQLLLAIYHNLGRLKAFIKELCSPGDTTTSHHSTLLVPSFAAEINDTFGPSAPMIALT